MHPQRPLPQASPYSLGQNLRDVALRLGRGKNLLGSNIAYGVIQSLKECLYFLLCCWSKVREHGTAGPNLKGEMSENSNSSGSGNSWTVLTPEEPAVENVGSGVEGTEIVTDTPVLAEEVTGSVTESETGDSMVQTGGVHFEEGLQEPAVENVGPEIEGTDILTDTPLLAAGVTGSVTELETGDCMAQTEGVCSEEGLQVCQETLSDSPHGSAPPSPTLLSPTPSSHISLSSSSFSPDPDTFSDTYTHISSFPESHISTSSYPESIVTVPTTASLEGEGIQQEEEKSELAKKVTEVGKQAEPSCDSELGEERGTEGDGLRKRKVFPVGPLDQQGDEDQELLRPREGEEDGGGLPLNKCILGALILLGLGTILFSGVFTDLDYVDDVDVRELSDAELHGSQEWLNSDADPQRAQENAELLDKLAKENEQIIALQAQLQAQKEELNTALQQAEERARESAWKGELEKENERMKQELSSLPSLQMELETLRARVMELTLLTAKEDSQQAPVSPSAPPPSEQTENGNQSGVVEETAVGTGEARDGGSLTEELERQKVLLEESRKRLEGMKVEGGGKRGVREGLAEMERRLTEEVEKLGRRGGGYLNKLEATEVRGKEEISKLIKEFFVDGVFTHDKISFRDFVEDVADILEDMVEGEGDEDEEREEEMEEFEKEALKKFSVTGGEEKEDIRVEWKRGNGRVRG
ncbi:hypothetical protein MATL_G00129110 [Megalops atlanticus]|uniref:Pre-B-cell leukemia transcription factor-interacting protein 1 n=1 Tax=Megalops atlanticus TaxID=7932 RepID=A0A9D3T6Z9_MEGAT|nr:hypothetical protein MATL_G00129110 [Megalops atlanticus]